MASVYVTQSGAGTEDGSSLENAIAIGSLTTTEWNLPARSADGAERVYFYGNITTLVRPLTGGTDSTDRLWIDTTNAIILVDSTTAISSNQKSNLVFVLGVVNSHVTNTELVLVFRSSNTKITGGTLTNTDNDASQCIRVLGLAATNSDNIEIDNVTCINTSITTLIAILFTHTSGIGDTSIYTNCSVTNCRITGGKIEIRWPDYIQSVITDGRRDNSFTIDNNTINGSPGPAIQVIGLANTPTSYISNNTITNSGLLTNATNAIQLNNLLGGVVENNTIDTVLCDGVGDGNGIIIDFLGTSGGGIGNYSENMTVRGNIIKNCNASTTAAGISLWGGKDINVYGNICIDNNNGIAVPDAASGPVFTLTGITAGADTVIDYVQNPDNGFEIEAGDEVTFTGTSGLTPDIDGVHTVKAKNTSNQFTIELSTSGTWNSDGSLSELHRGFNNKVNNNLCLNNVTGQIVTRYGGQPFEMKNNILIGGVNGYDHNPSQGSALSSESYNIFYNHSGDSIDDGGSPVAIDVTSIDASKNPLDENNELINDVEFIGKGDRWWTGPNPLGSDRYPFADVATDIGDKQTHFNPLHPAYKG